MDGARDVALLQPTDPRSQELAAEAPEAAEGLYEGTLAGSGARVHLVHTPDVSLGVVNGDGEPRWVTVVEGELVPLDLPDAAQPNRDLAGDTLPTPDAGDAPATASAASAGDATLQVLLDGDAEYLEEYEEDWDDHQLQVIHLVDAIYQEDLGISIEVVEQHVWQDATTQPVTSTDVCTATGMLPQFRDHWETVRPTTSAPRETAHLFSGKDVPGNVIGCAYLGVLETSYAYGVSVSAQEIYNGTSDLHYDTILAAHEVGHNFDGRHLRAWPNPYGSFSTCVGATIMYPGLCLEQPKFSGAEDPEMWSDLGTYKGGNVPLMQDHASGRI